jgi:hypothetical protein
MYAVTTQLLLHLLGSLVAVDRGYPEDAALLLFVGSRPEVGRVGDDRAREFGRRHDIDLLAFGDVHQAVLDQVRTAALAG